MRILIVEDDPSIALVLQEALTEEGHAVDVATSKGAGYELARLFPYGLFIFDVMLPEGPEAGYHLARALRDVENSTPILFLTARNEIDDRVMGLDAGGDDYLGKPFSLKELHARVRALLRRPATGGSDLVALPLGWHLDVGARDAVQQSQEAKLSKREFNILELLARAPGRVFSRQEIIERLWSGEDAIEEKVIDVYISTIRRKTDEHLIETVRGQGYRLALK